MRTDTEALFNETPLSGHIRTENGSIRARTDTPEMRRFARVKTAC